MSALWAHLNRRSSTDLFKVVDELGSSYSQVKMLFLLEDGGEHSLSEIAGHLGLSLPAASRAVDGLIQRVFVTRRESVSDRRSRLIALSAHGREVVERLSRARLATLDSFVADITPEERTSLLAALLPMGFTMSPMSTAAMNAVDRTKAGVASGTLSMTRMVGGTFGVAALGALVATVGRHDLAESLPGVPGPVRERLVDALGSGAVVAGAPGNVRAASEQAFVNALGAGLTIAAIATALAAWFMIDPVRPAPEEVPAAKEPEAAMV